MSAFIMTLSCPVKGCPFELPIELTASPAGFPTEDGQVVVVLTGEVEGLAEHLADVHPAPPEPDGVGFAIAVGPVYSEEFPHDPTA